MRIAVVGAGIVGVGTAYELAADGHEVTVFERHSSVAEGASFATAGMLGPGCVTSWEAPGKPAQRLRQLLARHTPLRLERPLAAADLAWLRRWLRAGDAASQAIHRARLLRLAGYSRQRLREVAARMAYDFDRSEGCLVLLRSEQEQRQIQPGLALLRELGLPAHDIGAAEARQFEPGLNPHTPLAGAIHLPQDEVGNCRQFAVILRDAAEQLGARFLFKTAVIKIGSPEAATVYIATEPHPRHFDALVLCAGASSAALLAPLGIGVPLRPVHGYSISAPIADPARAPRSGVLDQRHQVTVTRLGRRLRVAGMAAIGGRADSIDPKAVRALFQVLADWFPGVGPPSSGVQTWKGARPMLPDDAPVIGPSGLPGLWLNLGHGASGWALACGSARVLADQIAGRAPEIDAEGLDVQRFGVRR